MSDRDIASRICARLNALIVRDRQLVQALFTTCVAGDNALNEIDALVGANGDDGSVILSVLGILNSVLQRTNLGRGLITATFNDADNTLLYFCVTPEDDV